jgi:sugar lactone lactonase YvrE
MHSQPWIGDLGFPEGPRWHDGRLWFSDFGDCVVRSVDVGGRITEAAQVSARPSGLGWAPDGSLLVVSMGDRKVLRFRGGRMVGLADLSGFAEFSCNDMVVDARGNAYVGHFGFDLLARPPQPKLASLIFVRADGSVSLAAPDLAFPNGVVLSPDGRTLIVAETFAARLTAFDVAADGTLSGRRVFAALPGRSPDGICIDREGAIWVADAAANQCVRVRDGGEVTDVVTTTQRCYACVLGGPDGRTLFLCTAPGYLPADLAKHTAAIERLPVTVPGPV